MAGAAENALAGDATDGAAWLCVAFAGGIAAWFVLDNAAQWRALIGLCLAVALAVPCAMGAGTRHPCLRLALIVMPLALAAGCGAVWSKSALAGAPPIARPLAGEFRALVLSRQEQPAESRQRLVLALREPDSGRAIRVRVNVPLPFVAARATPGALVRLRARLVPPAPPMLPGGHDFARTAWFAGISATGSALGPVEVLRPGAGGGALAALQAALAQRVRSRMDEPAGSIAAALASGDRGAIPQADAQAMRDAGLAHLLSISGLHVSAVIGAAYVLALRLLALWPGLALRLRLPLLAAGAGALAGIGYTLLTGAEVPTLRSCIGALLVLAALALGREPLSLRMLAIAAFLVLLAWPEALVGPSFQMSFASVLAIVALAGSRPVRAFLTPRDEGWAARGLRRLAIALGTGIVIEAALMPIGLFHFHRAGIYGAFANLVAIPLTTLATMPLLALALVLDLVGAGAPAWWLAGWTIDAMLALARWIAAQPGAVSVLPAMGAGAFALFCAGGLWLALWSGPVRLAGLLPVAIGAALLALLRPPDILVTGDGHHVGLVDPDAGTLAVLRETRSAYVRDNLSELAGMTGAPRPLAQLPGVRCSADFCALRLWRGGRAWDVLIARSRDWPAERAVAAACERADIVIADRRLPRACRPRWLKADRAALDRSGGLAIDLTRGRVASVAQGQGQHGWWHPVEPPARRRPGVTAAMGPAATRPPATVPGATVPGGTVPGATALRATGPGAAGALAPQ